MMLDADKMVAAASSRNPTLAGALTRLQRCAFSGSWEVCILYLSFFHIMQLVKYILLSEHFKQDPAMVVYEMFAASNTCNTDYWRLLIIDIYVYKMPFYEEHIWIITKNIGYQIIH